MSRASEEVLLIVSHVKNKKCEGSLYMMGQRMAWMPQAKSTFTISYNYADIRVQKISPDSKEKVQLQVVLYDGNANTFHFANPQGRPTQVKDRESVKELLQQLLPKFRRKVSSELEEKNRMLQEDQKLFQLYKDLVVSGIVTADEFWAQKAAASGDKTSSQEVGVSQAFLADIKPQTDGCNGLKYNLTVDIIESIFRTYPAVKQKHAENVPDKLSEQEFWTRFFQSHYFHRDRTNLGSKDIFSDCAKSDEQDILKEISKPVEDPLVDLGRMTDTAAGEGYGLETTDKDTPANAANASLIRRFNQHSTMVLKACDKAKRTQSGADSANSPQVSSGVAAARAKMFSHDEPSTKQIKLRGKIEYSDLQQKSSEQTAVSVQLVNSGRYLHGPTPITAVQYHTGDDILTSCQAVTAEVLGWQPQLTQVLHSSSAVGVLMELSPGGTLMQGPTSQQIHQMAPADIQTEISNAYSALGELLRHFWACFPITDKALEEKVIRMQASLDRFRQTKLRPLQDKQMAHHLGANLIGHMDEMIQAALTKFTGWQTRRMSKKL